MIKISDKTKCSGCSACQQICPVSCIEMEKDKEGFIYPKADESICIKCGKCIISCRYSSESFKHLPENKDIKTYAYIHDDNEVLLASSSGGAFTAISDYILLNNGYVIGALYNNNLEVIHEVTNDTIVRDKFRKSKYVQSNINNTFKKVKQLLKEEIVLFSGTPCQVAGLYAYLGGDYKNLYTIDLLCKGVVSPEIFQDYIDMLQKKYKNKIIDYRFRDKEDGWGKKREKYIKVFTQDGKARKINKKTDIYYGIFSRAVGLRPSCGSCIFVKEKRESDITIGDFHDIEKYLTNEIFTNGASLILANSSKGQILLNNLSKANITPILDYKKDRTVFNTPTKLYVNRESFFNDYESYGLKIAAFKHVTVKRFISKIMKVKSK